MRALFSISVCLHMYMCEHTANQRHNTGHGSHVFRHLFRFIAPTDMCLSRLLSAVSATRRYSARDSGVGADPSSVPSARVNVYEGRSDTLPSYMHMHCHIHTHDARATCHEPRCR